MKKTFLFLLMILTGITAATLAGCSSKKDAVEFKKEGSSDMNWHYTYDDQGRMKEITGPGDRTTAFSYKDDVKTNFTRRVTRTDADSGKTTYDLDEWGRTVKMSDPTGVTRYSYDDEDRLTGVMREASPGITYTYDSAGRLSALRVGENDNRRVDYTYDFLGRLAAISTPTGDITFQYQAGDGRIIRTLPNGIFTVFSYQPDGKLKEIVHADRNNQVIAKYTYASRPDGLIEQIAEWSPRGERAIDYSYDEVQRLVAVDDSRQGRTEFTYDKLGNRLAVKGAGKEKDAAAYDWSGKMTQLNGEACLYDAAYNLEGYGSDAAGRRFEYDALNSLKSVAGNSGEVTYQYDGDGSLVSRRNQGRETQYVLEHAGSAWRPLMIRDAGGKDTFIIWDGNVPLMSISGNDVKYWLHDHLGSVRTVADRSGAIVDTYDYSPFGVPENSDEASDLRPGFAGLFYDPAAGLYLTLARAYDPQTGRFLQTDPQFRIPTGSQQDLSPYVYCGNDPVNFVDRNGAQAESYTMENLPLGLYRSGPLQVYRDWMSHLPSRENIMDNVAAKAFREPLDPAEIQEENVDKNALITQAYFKVLRWHSNTGKMIEDFPDVTTRPTPWELRNVENQLYAQMVVETGKNRKMVGFFDADPGLSAAAKMTYVMIPAWSAVHSFFEAYNIPNPIDEKGWMPHDRATIGRHHLGVRMGLMNYRSGTSAPIRERFDYFENSGTRKTGTSTFSRRYEHSRGGIARVTRYSTKYHEHHDGPALSKAVERYDKTGIWEYPPRTSGTIPKLNEPSVSFDPPEEKERQRKRRDEYDSTRNIGWGGGDDGGGGGGGGSWRGPGGGGDSWKGGGGPWSGPGGGGPWSGPGGGDSWRGGGPWRGPGGSTPGFGDNWKSGGEGWGSRSSARSAMRPSNVGGVYLRGAGEALKDLGTITGLAVDDNGRLILLSEDDQAVGLPPLRLDDVVTVFRSVYEHGSPYVSIDPDPKDPQGPVMLVRHDEGTAGTYAGWILFEADRVMKAYSLGEDNVTRDTIDSKVPGYQSLLELGFSKAANDDQEKIWERFWIVPAEVRRRQSADTSLSLFDVPLKVNTQRMVLEKGVLEPAEGKEPSPAARTFSEWFTKNYDRIAGESRSVPVNESGMHEPVAAFSELRRIALVTAIAENLRDQGVPMPAWMQEHTIKPFPVPETTPAITVRTPQTETQGSEVELFQIYGGVRLAPEDKAVRVVKGSPDAERMQKAVTAKMKSIPTLAPAVLAVNGKDYRTVALPGEQTGDLGGNILRETDLVVPVSRGTAIGLTRQFHSFFQPRDAWGSGWTLDLPLLKQVLLPIERTGDETKYQTIYRLTSPLGSYSESFRDIRFVPEVNAELIVPQNTDIVLGLADANIKEIGTPTTQILFRDGSQWHFDTEGYLAAAVDGPAMVAYRRNQDHRIVRIEGWYGKNLLADIRMEYDDNGRMTLARGSSKEEVRYDYGDADLLEEVAWKEGKLDYGYGHGLVTSIKVGGEEVRGFSYDSQGRLLEERWPQGDRRTFAYEGQKVTSSLDDLLETTKYDSLMRPVEQRYADGTLVEWDYPEGDTTVTTITPLGFKPYRTVSKDNGRHVQWELPDGETWSADYDAAYRLTSLREGGSTIMRQQWHLNGLPGDTSYETYAERPRYDEHGVLTGMMVTPPGNQEKFSEWVTIEYNALGFPGKVTDYSGAETKIAYGKDGQPSVVASGQGGIEMKYDEKGRTRTVNTTWGERQSYSYDDKNGFITEISLKAGGKKAGVKFDQGSPVALKQFDGGEHRFEYDEANGSRLKGIQTPNNVKLHYGYDESGRLEKIHCDGTFAYRFSYDDQGRLAGLSRVPLE